MDDELTAADYFARPLVELSSHPDFDPEVYAFVGQLSKMTTATLQTLMERNVPNG